MKKIIILIICVLFIYGCSKIVGYEETEPGFVKYVYSGIGDPSGMQGGGIKLPFMGKDKFIALMRAGF